MVSIIAAYTAIRWSNRSLASSVSVSHAGDAGSRGLSGQRPSITPMAAWRRCRASRSRSHPALYLPRCLAMTSAGAMGGGVSSAIARALGSGDAQAARRLVAHALVIAAGMGFLFTVVVLLLGPAVYRLLGGDGQLSHRGKGG